MKTLFKKTLILSSLLLAFLSFSSVVLPNSAHAADNSAGGLQQDEAGHFFVNGTCRSFLGLTSWDCGVQITNEDTLKTGIWLIVANVASDIAIIAAYLILGFVIYGGYQYMFASGDPGKISTGKKTLFNAFIGLAIVMSANIIMSSLRIVLTNGTGNISDCISHNCVDANLMVTGLIQWTVGIAGVVAAIFLVYGGVLYISSTGDPAKIKKARDTILYALIGLAIVALAEIVTAFISSNILRDNIESNGQSLNNSLIIEKEVTA